MRSVAATGTATKRPRMPPVQVATDDERHNDQHRAQVDRIAKHFGGDEVVDDVRDHEIEDQQFTTTLPDDHETKAATATAGRAPRKGPMKG